MNYPTATPAVKNDRILMRNHRYSNTVDKAIKDMPEDFEIKEYLMEHLSEVKNMCITEYNEAETMELFKRDAREEGREEGREEERRNTEKEYKRAEKERKRADEAERRVAELEALLASK